MTFILKMICKNCNSENCKYHEEKKTVVDKTTGIEFEANCICNHMKKGGELI